MQKILVFVGALLFPTVVGEDSIAVRKSNPEILNFKTVVSEERSPVNSKNSIPLEFLVDVRHFSQLHISNKEKTKHGRERTRKRKNKSEKYFGQKSKSHRLSNDMLKHIRNNEKTNLVRNKTIEILKSGLRILRAGEYSSQNGSKPASRMNETLLEKILSSAVQKKDVFPSGTGAFNLSSGTRIYERKVQLPVSQIPLPLAEDILSKEPKKQQNKNVTEVFNKNYDFEYNLLPGFSINRSNDSLKENDHYETVNVDKTVGVLLKQIEKAFRNLTNCSNERCSREENANFEDSCQKWLNCRGTLRRAFSGNNKDLPSCPCIYPSTVYYDEMIWDKKLKKYFRWKDASDESERLDIYKPGAVYCIRSLLTRGSLSVSSQQCCYDRSQQLLTRGSGAGTVNFISPDISKKLHYTIDILPWRLCKGDFTRYKTARNTNNGNDCPENPDEDEYQLQLKLTKIF